MHLEVTVGQHCYLITPAARSQCRALPARSAGAPRHRLVVGRLNLQPFPAKISRDLPMAGLQSGHSERTTGIACIATSAGLRQCRALPRILPRREASVERSRLRWLATAVLASGGIWRCGDGLEAKGKRKRNKALAL